MSPTRGRPSASSRPTRPTAPISQARALWRLARYRFGLWLLSGLLASVMFYLIPLLPGLVVQRFFDQLELDPAAPVTLLVLLLVAIGFGRMTQLLAAVATEVTVGTVVGTLLRVNLLEGVLRGRDGAGGLLLDDASLDGASLDDADLDDAELGDPALEDADRDEVAPAASAGATGSAPSTPDVSAPNADDPPTSPEMPPDARSRPLSSGDAISRFREDVEAVTGFLTWTIDPLGQGVVLLAAMIVLARVDARMTLFIFVPMVLIIALINRLRRRIGAYRKASREAAGAVSELLAELLGAVTAVQVSGAETKVVDRLRALNTERRRTALRDTLLTNTLQSISYYSAGISTSVLLLLSAEEIRSGRFSVGDFALFAAYLDWIATVVGMMGHYVTQYRQTGISLDRLQEMAPEGSLEALVRHRPLALWGAEPAAPGLDVPVWAAGEGGIARFSGDTPASEDASVAGDERDPDATPATMRAAALPNAPFRSLSARGLTVRFPGGAVGLRDADLDLRAGELVVVTGPVGAGKSTLLRAVLGLLPREAGEIRWNGELLDEPAGFMIPPNAAYTPQAPRLFSRSLRENILLGLPEARADIPSAIHAAVMEPDLAEMPESLDTLVGPRGARLSGGQVQRTAAARMFVRRPRVLVFDDLSSALDVETEAAMWARLFGAEKRDAKGDDANASGDAPADVTALVVSHRRPVLRRADRILLMDEGRIVDAGRLEELLERSALMRRLWAGAA